MNNINNNNNNNMKGLVPYAVHKTLNVENRITSSFNDLNEKSFFDDWDDDQSSAPHLPRGKNPAPQQAKIRMDR